MSSLFNSKTKSRDDLFKRLCDDHRYSRQREIVDDLWVRFQPFADKNFPKAIASDFHSRFWEMYLACTLTDLGFKLHPRRIAEGPDISLNAGNMDIWIEAVAPHAGQSLEMSLTEDRDELILIDDAVTLRYCSAIDEKFKKYSSYLENEVISKTEPYIIAVNGCNVPFSLSSDEPPDLIPNIVRAVLPFGEYTSIIDRDSSQVVGYTYPYRDQIVKESRAGVPTNIFLNSKYAGISGIIFSNDSLISMPKKVGEGLLFVHNPNARNRLSQGWLRAGCEYWLDEQTLRKKVW